MSGWPLVLRHADVTRILDRNTSRIVLTSAVKLGEYQVQDALVVRRNERYRKDGRFDLQQDPTVTTIMVTTVEEIPLIAVNLAIVRASGFKTQRDFYDEWLERRGWIDPDMLVRVCEFGAAEPVRLLHRQLHRGYTSDPRKAAEGEPEALNAADLAKYAATAAWRREREHREELGRQRARSIASKLKLAQARGDAREILRLTEEMADLAREMMAA